MRTSPRLAGALLVVTAAGLVASCGTSAEQCAMCGRDECRNLAFTIHLADGTDVETCCPRCALRYLEDEKPAVAGLEVKAFETARPLDARAAVYVEDSDVHPCSASREGPPKDERGCCLKPVYDRCLPSVLAFADRSAAEAFAREHGGFVTSFAELSDSVRVKGS